MTWRLFSIVCLLIASPSVNASEVWASDSSRGLALHVLEPLFFPLSDAATIAREGEHLRYWRIKWTLLLKNEGQVPISVVCSEKHGPRKALGQIGYFYAPESIRSGGRTVFMKPKPSDLDIVQLNPGEGVILGIVSGVYNRDMDGDSLSFVYSINPELARFYDCWVGALKAELSHDAILQFARARRN